MVKLSAYTAYNEYFNKKKALSIGLATSGSGIGTIAIPPLLRWLFDNFSFSGAILLYGEAIFSAQHQNWLTLIGC